MPRAKIIRTETAPYHITSRSNNREWFYIPIDDVWEYCNTLLEDGKEKFNVQIDAFVLMNNHYHLCMHTPDANIDSFMQFFNKNLSKCISKQAKRINRIFGAPYKWNLISNESYYFHVIRYIYQNPVKANITNTCSEYKYSDILKQGFNEVQLEWIETIIGHDEQTRTERKLRRSNIQ